LCVLPTSSNDLSSSFYWVFEEKNAGLHDSVCVFFVCCILLNRKEYAVCCVIHCERKEVVAPTDERFE